MLGGRRICDPACCDHCEYIGEGDFICDNFPDDQAILVMSDWEPTENFLKCKTGGIDDG
jgi:hypothetical protein